MAYCQSTVYSTVLNQNCIIMSDYIIYQISVRVKVPEYVSYFCIVSTDKKRSYVKEQYVCPSKHANFTVRSQAYLIFSVLAAPLPLAS